MNDKRTETKYAQISLISSTALCWLLIVSCKINRIISWNEQYSPEPLTQAVITDSNMLSFIDFRSNSHKFHLQSILFKFWIYNEGQKEHFRWGFLISFSFSTQHSSADIRVKVHKHTHESFFRATQKEQEILWAFFSWGKKKAMKIKRRIYFSRSCARWICAASKLGVHALSRFICCVVENELQHCCKLQKYTF